jgi:hypothetical protein
MTAFPVIARLEVSGPLIRTATTDRKASLSPVSAEAHTQLNGPCESVRNAHPLYWRWKNESTLPVAFQEVMPWRSL